MGCLPVKPGLEPGIEPATQVRALGWESSLDHSVLGLTLYPLSAPATAGGGSS